MTTVAGRAGVAAGLVVSLTLAAGCASSGDSADKKVTTSSANAVAPGKTLWVAGVLTKKTVAQWCVQDTVSTICAPPTPHLAAEPTNSKVGTGAQVRAGLSRTAAGVPPMWNAIVIHVG